jgi:tripartite-type tricarboxylate transporter receptor subunit TctC
MHMSSVLESLTVSRRALLTTLAALIALNAFTLKGARAEYPERPITLIVCFPPGGGADISARLINTPLGDALGKPVIIENRGGAGGNIATVAVARARPDGYTLLMCSSAFVVNPSLYANVAYDPYTDFMPIMVLAVSPNVFVVPAQSAIKTMTEFLAKAKANPGKLNWTSPGAGTTPYLAGEVLKLRTGIDMVHIPYTGAGPATVAALSAQVDLYCANIGSVSAMIKAGTLRAIAVTSKKRWPDLPDVPTLDELGIKNAESDTFQGIWAPAGTPKDVVDRLAKKLSVILARPDIKERYATSGFLAAAEPPDVFRARIAHEVPLYKEIIDKAGLKIK